MPPKRNNRRKDKKPQTAGALADCALPQDVMLCILTRLPVKSIHRFKSVCKPWRNFFSTPKFTKMHHAQFSQNPENQSVVIYGRTAKRDHTVSLLKIGSDENKPTKLSVPFPPFFCGADFVGCCNGLVCMDLPPLGQLIILWNPALNNMSKRLPIPGLEVGAPDMVSLGFGYDDKADDFKVVRIVAPEKNKKANDFKVFKVVSMEKKKKKKGKKMSLGVEVYSANSNSWRTIEPGFQFSVFMTRCDAIVNGNPYWVAKVDDDDGDEVLVCFDVRKMEFKVVPLPSLLNLGEHIDVAFVDWKGAIAILALSKNDERVLSLDVWGFDDVGKIGWTKNHICGPIELKVDRVLQCLKNGRILVGECLEDGKVYVFDTENIGVGTVKEIVIDGAENGSFHIYGYTESLAYIKGMETEDEHKRIDALALSVHVM